MVFGTSSARARLGLVAALGMLGTSIPSSGIQAAPAAPAFSLQATAMLAQQPAQRQSVPPAPHPTQPVPRTAPRAGDIFRAPGQPANPAQAPAPILSPTEIAARQALQNRIEALGRGFNGLVGIAVRDIDSGYAASWNGHRLFPQQSVSKFWVALAAYDAVDKGRLDLGKSVTLRRDDLTLFHQPIAARIGANGYKTTLGKLIHEALTRSDNTANDFVLWQAGGPDAVRDLIARHGIQGVRFGPGERLLQSGIAGMTWNQAAMSRGRGFEQARARVPASVRRRSFDAYVEDPIDGASALALTQSLARLQKGELLSAQSTRHMLDTMSQTRTGPRRLTGGLAPGWRIAHKTGTGQVFGGAQAGYNDIGIITAPNGRRYALAVMIGRTTVPNIVRMQLMQNVTKAAIDYHEARGSARFGG